MTLAGEVALKNRMVAVANSLEQLRYAAAKLGFNDVSHWRRWVKDIKSVPEIIQDVTDHLADVNRTWAKATRELTPAIHDDPNAPADWTEWQGRTAGLTEAQRAFNGIAGDQSIGAFIRDTQRQIKDEQFSNAVKEFSLTVALTVVTGMGAAKLGGAVRSAITTESAFLRGAGFVADVAINASINTAVQMLMASPDQKVSGSWAMVENTLMEVFTRGLMSRVQKLQATAVREAQAMAALPNLSAAERQMFTNMRFAGLDLTAEVIGGLATQWAAHQIVEHARKLAGAKGEPGQSAGGSDFANTVYQQGASIGLGKYFHGKLHAWNQHKAELSRSRLADLPETKAFLDARDQFQRDAKSLAESLSPDPMAGERLAQRHTALLAQERALLERLPRKTERASNEQLNDTQPASRQNDADKLHAKKSEESGPQASVTEIAKQLSSEDQRQLEVVLAFDPKEGRRLIAEYGESQVLEFIWTSPPVSSLPELAAGLKKRRARVQQHVDGLASATATVPDGWRFDTVGPFAEADGTKVVQTQVYGPNGTAGYYERAYNPQSKELELRMAFNTKNGQTAGLPNMVKTQSHSVEMIDGKGTPTLQYVTLHQMNLLGVPIGGAGASTAGVEKVHLSDIQFVDTIVHLHWLRQNKKGDLSALVTATPSIVYAEMTALQSGYVRSHEPLVLGGQEVAIGRLMEFQERGPNGRNLERVKQNDELLAKYGFDRNTVMLWGFDVDFLVRPKQ